MKPWVGFASLVEREILRFFSVFRQTVIPPAISSFLYFFIFGASLGRHLNVLAGLPYMKFLVPGIVMMYVIESSFANTSSSLFIARWGNHIQELLVSPLSYTEMVMAFLIGGLARGVITGVVVFLVSHAFVHIDIADPWLALYFVVLVALAFSAAGILAGLVAEEFDHLSVFSTFVITPLVFFGGVFHSREIAPQAIQNLTALNPIFYMINGLRYAMVGVSDTSVSTSMAAVAGVFLFIFALVVYLFRRGYKLRA